MTTINWSNFTDFGQLPLMANTASDGTFWVGMLYMTWIILLLVMIEWGFEVALLSSAFVSMIIGFLLVYAGLMSWSMELPFIGMILVMFIYIFWSRR
jgi:hypothetical protein